MENSVVRWSKRFVIVNTISADSNNFSIDGEKILMLTFETLADGASTSEISRIKVKNQPLAAKIVKSPVILFRIGSA